MMKTILIPLCLLSLVFAQAPTATNVAGACAAPNDTGTHYDLDFEGAQCILKAAYSNMPELTAIAGLKSGVTANVASEELTVTFTIAESNNCSGPCLDTNHYEVSIENNMVGAVAPTSVSNNLLVVSGKYTKAQLENPFICHYSNPGGNDTYTCVFKASYKLKNIASAVIVQKTATVIVTATGAEVSGVTATSSTINTKLVTINTSIDKDMGQNIAGTLKRYDDFGTKTEIDTAVVLGGVVNLELTATDTAEQNTDFSVTDGDYKIFLVQGSTEIDITDSKTATPTTVDLNNGASPLHFAFRVSVNVHFIGTYKLKVQAKHAQGGRRILSETSELETSFSEASIPLTVLPREDVSGYTFAFVAVVAVFGIAFSLGLYSQNQKLQKKIYEEIKQNDFKV